MVSFVAQARSQPQTPLASALGRHLAYEIAPSDGAPAAATTTNSDFGGRRFMDSFKVEQLPPCRWTVDRCLDTVQRVLGLQSVNFAAAAAYHTVAIERVQNTGRVGAGISLKSP